MSTRERLLLLLLAFVWLAIPVAWLVIPLVFF
jgi:hypothetical protein